MDAPADAAQLGYTHADFTIDSFAGIAVDGAEATVVLRGTECYRTLSGLEACDPPSDFRIELHATSDGRWVIATKTSRFLPGHGP